MRAFRLLLAAMVLAWAGSAMAVEIPKNQPNPDRAALERQLENQTAMPDHNIQGFVHIPDQNEGVLVQPMGREFRDFRTHYQPWIDLALVIAAVAAMALLYLVAGPMTYTKDPKGRTIKRFTVLERFSHWLTAVSFVWLALTGLNLVWGRAVLQPVLGDDTFSSVTALMKESHNFVGFAFIIGLVMNSVQWLKYNIPKKIDLEWIKRAGGIFGGPHIPAEKFNFGQKMIYWIALFGGGAICITGLLLLFPFYATGVNGMQIVHGLHSVIAALMVAVIIGHAYLGSIGVGGSFQAMRTGRVDLNWAKTHHPLWVEQEAAKGRLPPGDLDAPAPAPAE